MASNMSREQLDTIRAVFNSSWDNYSYFISLLIQYDVNLNDLIAALGVDVQYMCDYFYGAPGVPDGWGGLPSKREWYAARQRGQNFTTAGALQYPMRLTQSANYDGRNNYASTAVNTSYIEDPAYHGTTATVQLNNDASGLTFGTVVPVVPMPVVTMQNDYVVSPTSAVNNATTVAAVAAEIVAIQHAVEAVHTQPVISTALPNDMIHLSPVEVPRGNVIAPSVTAPAVHHPIAIGEPTPGQVVYAPPQHVAGGSSLAVIAAIIAALGFM